MKAETIATVVVKTMAKAFKSRDARQAETEFAVEQMRSKFENLFERLESRVVELEADKAAKQPVRE